MRDDPSPSAQRRSRSSSRIRVVHLSSPLDRFMKSQLSPMPTKAAGMGLSFTVWATDRLEALALSRALRAIFSTFPTVASRALARRCFGLNRFSIS